MRYLLLALVLCLFSTPTFSRVDFIQEYILSGMPFEVVFDNYGFTEDKWIGRCDHYTTAKLCRKTYIGRFNKVTRTWEFTRFNENTGKFEKFKSQALSNGDPLNYEMLIFNERFHFDEKGRVLHAGDGKVASVSPSGDINKTYSVTKPVAIKKNASDFKNEGYELIQRMEYPDAIQTLNKAIKLNPMDSVSYYYRGYALIGLKDYYNAIMDLEKATILDPSFANAYSSLAISYTELKDYNRAITSGTKAIILNPKDGTSYYNRGIAYYFLGKHEDAYRDFDEVVKLEPTNQDAKTNRDILFKKLSNK
ncbi:tetratricopeptide repeat protein [Desulfobacterota bacterium AH_259_B03_O07]|nr:tetratricopeptide repeat protein [Desulfobacterota bacterium AH_259_B03_O07]